MTAQTLRPGDLLANGSILLATRTKDNGDTYVLALSGREYVTWYLAKHEPCPRLGGTSSGHYHGQNLSQALESLATR